MFKLVTTVLAALSGVALALALSIGFLAFANSNNFLSYSYNGGATYPPPMPPVSVPSTIRLMNYQSPGDFGLTATPAAYDNASSHSEYQITITSGSSGPMTVHATLAPDNHCSIELARKPTWAHMNGPSAFTLAPHESKNFIVSVGQPPSGKSELVATFVASAASPKSGVSTSAGVGTALRFSEPGKTVIAPCPKPKASTNPHVRTIVVGASKPAADTAPLQFAIGALTGLLILLVLGFAYLRFRNRGTHR